MFMYTHKNRNIVVSKEMAPDSGTHMVSWVALSPSVSGKAKRGRRPDFSRPVAVADLSPMSVSDVSDIVKADAEAAVAKMS